MSGSTSAAFGNVHICVHINIKPFFAVIFKEIEQNEQSNESVLINLRFFPILANFIHCQPQRAWTNDQAKFCRPKKMWQG